LIQRLTEPGVEPVKIITTFRNRGAIALGFFFAGVTAFVLFKDVIDGAAVTTNHVLALSALVAAIASGHMALPQLQLGRVLSGLALGLILVANTFYVIISSGARNAETAAMKAAGVAQVNADRLRIETDLKDAKARHRAAPEAQAKECSTG